MSKESDNAVFARLAQTEMARLGFYRGDLDSWAGVQTQAAFRELLNGEQPVTAVIPVNNSARLYAHALKDNGLREVAGAGSNPRIQQAILGAASWLDPNDSKTAWCGCIMGLWCKELGLPVPAAYYRAANWLEIGTPVQLADAVPGDIVVISRSGGNHVALFKNASMTLYGGNQSDAVNHAAFDRSLLRGIRRL